jgi:hypothetical protein
MDKNLLHHWGKGDFSRPKGRLKPPLPDVNFHLSCLPAGRQGAWHLEFQDCFSSAMTSI